MAEEKVVTEGKVSISSSHPSMNVLRGLGNLQGGKGGRNSGAHELMNSGCLSFKERPISGWSLVLLGKLKKPTGQG